MAKSNFELLCNVIELEIRKNHDTEFYCDRIEFDGKNKFMWISTQDGNIGGCICHYELRLGNDNDNDEDNQEVQDKVYVEFHIEQEPNNNNTSFLVQTLCNAINNSQLTSVPFTSVSCRPSSYHWYRRNISSGGFPLCCDVNNISAIVGELYALDKLVNGSIKQILS